MFENKRTPDQSPDNTAGPQTSGSAGRATSPLTRLLFALPLISGASGTGCITPESRYMLSDHSSPTPDNVRVEGNQQRLIINATLPSRQELQVAVNELVLQKESTDPKTGYHVFTLPLDKIGDSERMSAARWSAALSQAENIDLLKQLWSLPATLDLSLTRPWINTGSKTITNVPFSTVVSLANQHPECAKALQVYLISWINADNSPFKPALTTNRDGQLTLDPLEWMVEWPMRAHFVPLKEHLDSDPSRKLELRLKDVFNSDNLEEVARFWEPTPVGASKVLDWGGRKIGIENQQVWLTIPFERTELVGLNFDLSTRAAAHNNSRIELKVPGRPGDYVFNNIHIFLERFLADWSGSNTINNESSSRPSWPSIEAAVGFLRDGVSKTASASARTGAIIQLTPEQRAELARKEALNLLPNDGADRAADKRGTAISSKSAAPADSKDGQDPAATPAVGSVWSWKEWCLGIGAAGLGIVALWLGFKPNKKA